MRCLIPEAAGRGKIRAPGEGEGRRNSPSPAPARDSINSPKKERKKYTGGAAPQISHQRGNPEAKEEQFNLLFSYCRYISSFVLLMTNKVRVLSGSEEIRAGIEWGMLRFGVGGGF